MEKWIVSLVVMLMFVGGSTNQLWAQGCQIDLLLPTQDTTICEGDSVHLVSDGSCSFLMNNGFDNGTIGTGWSTTAANPVFNNPCGPGPNGPHMWVGTTASTSRTMVTNAYDISVGGCQVEFWMRYGLQPSAGNCEDPDAQDEGVHLQYSVNGGTSWTDFPGGTIPVGVNSTTGPFTNVTTTPGTGGYWTPLSSGTAQQASTLYHWHKYVSPVPAVAITTATTFRFAQLMTSNTGYDAWGIDEVQITCSNFGQIVLWSHGPATLDGGWVAPTTTTSYVVMIMDFLGNIASDTVTINVIPKIEPNLGSDTIICAYPGDSVALDAGSYANYSWNTGATTQTIGAFTTGLYSVTCSEGACSGTDSIYVTLSPPPTADAGTDQEICIGDSATLTSPLTPGMNYVWDTGDSTNSIVVDPTTTQQYVVTVSIDSNCSSTDTVEVLVHQLPNADAGVDEEICEGDSVLLIASGGTQYVWDTGVNGSQMWAGPAAATTYMVTVTDAYGCVNSDTVNVGVNPLPDVEIISAPDSLCYGDSAVFIASGATSYMWDIGVSTDQLQVLPTSSKLYRVFGTDDNGCQNTDAHFLFMDDCTTLYVPSAFVPDGSIPENKLFLPMGELSGIELYELFIFDRLGKQIFYTNDINEGWDGKNKNNVEMPTGVYTYMIKFRTFHGNTFNKAGTITLIR